MRRSLGPFLLLILIALLAVPKLISKHQQEESAPAAQAKKKALRVRIEEVHTSRLVEELSTTGTVRANEQVELVSEVAGKVTAILFEEGRRVAKGQVLLQLETSELDAEVERRRYRLELAEQRERRQKELLDEGVISQDNYDLAQNELNVLRAELSLTTARLEKTRIRAPFSGRIGLRNISLGTYLSPQTIIATLQDLDPVKIDFTVPEQYAGRLSAGQEIEFSVKGIEAPFTGTIYALEPGVDAESRSLTLRARSANPEGRLLPGAFADVKLVVEDVPEALTVPNLAVIPELGGKKVFVLQDGKAEPRSVETGIRSVERIQITSGLEIGEQVITSAIQQLRPGLDVEAAE